MTTIVEFLLYLVKFCIVYCSYVVFFAFFFCLFETGSHYAVQAGLELTFVAQAGLKLALILLPQPPKCWDYRHGPPRPASGSTV